MPTRPFPRVSRLVGRPSLFASTTFRVFAFILAMAVPVRAWAQDRTDVVTLANGDRITGEVLRMERGRLEFKTDDAGTLYLEWDKLISLVANRQVEVLTSDGRRFLGTLVSSTNRSIGVAGADGVTALQMSDVSLMAPIGRSFWAKFDGSIDAGFSYTQSSGIAQLNANWDQIYRKPASSIRMSASLTQTVQQDEDSEGDDRGYVQAAYLHYPWRHWFVTAGTRFETNQSLGLDLRSQVGGVIGPRLINNLHAQMTFGAGAVFNDERGVDVEPTQNLEGLLAFQTSYFTYDRPKTNLDVSLQYYSSLTDRGRRRVQLDAGVKRELWNDFFVGLNVYETFDSRPPNPDANQNDFGIAASIGWTY
jgi:hypothetical protein